MNHFRLAGYATSMAVVLSCRASTVATPPTGTTDSALDASAPAPAPTQEACSDGPRWPNGTKFSYETNGPVDAPPCIPHCGPNASASALWGPPALGKLTSAALPSGSCADEGNVCTMGAEWLGPCPPGGTAAGPFDLFICRCTSSKWECTVDATSPSSTEQTCSLPDDAGTEDGGSDN